MTNAEIQERIEELERELPRRRCPVDTDSMYWSEDEDVRIDRVREELAKLRGLLHEGEDSKS